MNYTITAKNSEEFLKIESELNKLPVQILSQIENVKNGIVGIECVIRDTFKEKQTIILPKETTQIENFGEYIGIYSNEFFFKIQGSLLEKKLSYAFIETKK